MYILCDTNLLIRSVSENDPNHQTAITAIRELRAIGHILVIVPQCVYEFYVVVTRPVENNGLGVTPQAAQVMIEGFTQTMPLLRDERQIFEHWSKLVDDYDVIGKQAHDTRLVAAMDRHGIGHLLTFNDRDFQRFSHITVMLPADIAAENE